MTYVTYGVNGMRQWVCNGGGSASTFAGWAAPGAGDNVVDPEHHGSVPPAAPLQRTGEVFLDARSGSRALRVTWHHESEVVVLSLWRDNLCTATFRLAVDEVPALIEVLRSGLDAAYDAHRPAPRAAG